MEDSKNLDHHDEILDKGTLEIKNEESNSTSNIKSELNQDKDSKISLIENRIDKGNNKIDGDKTFEGNIKEISSDKDNINNSKNNQKKNNSEIISEKKPEDSKLAFADPIPDKATNVSAENIDKVSKEESLEKQSEDFKLAIANSNSDKATIKSAENVDKDKKEESTEKQSEENKKVILNNKSNIIADKKIPKEITPTNTAKVKAKTKPVKEPPIEKKPFLEFINDYLIPEIKNEFKMKGKEINKIDLQKTHRPIAEDICWVIYCEINDTCNFWLSFEKDDITSLKSFSLCKNYEKPSIIESFLIDEKKITLKLIISRILQRLNGQKLIGAN